MRTHKKKKKMHGRRLLGLLIAAAVIPLVFYWAEEMQNRYHNPSDRQRPEIHEYFLEPNPYSRPGISLKRINGIVIHYTANPGTDAFQTRNYFNGLKDSRKTFASSHFVIATDGSIIQCIPLDEIAYCSNERNYDTISIECCHEKTNGAFTQAEYQALRKLTKWLCKKYNIKQSGLLRHYDVTGKKCPLYFVQYPEKWEQFCREVFE